MASPKDAPSVGPVRRPSWTSTSLEFSIKELGLEPPPGAVRVRFLRGHNRWTVILQSSEATASQLERWLAPARPASTRSTRPDGHILWAYFVELPREWERFIVGMHASDLGFGRDGMVRLEAAGPAADIDRWVRQFGTATGPTIGHAPFRPLVRPGTGLTARQLEALSAAWFAGYYAVPRRMTLTGLARQLEISPAALWELLRRAEGAVVSRFLASVGGRPPSTPLPTRKRGRSNGGRR